ncbi:hypothetical protein GBE28_21700 [Salmonella enterica]|uniref:hypothetical protein n=1 Tax=Salmonella enterica TaxID=28901 RepID=UPI000D58540E|nr:hypothetical protein [Salmonella enterica]EAW1864048.1 hypothetical protein [Salmonella enterica subsp. enterica]EDR2628297.1 hypothetical protein [Salmonella enterica subsp. enterica serovar Thompson]EDX5692675.1 hypothetical protein [Salmonella enterica subsp. arizonae]EAA8475718.1 hypothetical protein [Salmonella enterica]EAZ0471515.1 hypothetical protein [Salmonella enterica]
MKNNNLDFNEIIIDVVERIRLADELDENLINRLYESLDKAVIAYENEESIPKLLAYDLLVLHDNLEGALRFYSGEDKIKISDINSKINKYIEKIFLN